MHVLSIAAIVLLLLFFRVCKLLVLASSSEEGRLCPHDEFDVSEVGRLCPESQFVRVLLTRPIATGRVSITDIKNADEDHDFHFTNEGAMKNMNQEQGLQVASSASRAAMKKMLIKIDFHQQQHHHVCRL